VRTYDLRLTDRQVAVLAHVRANPGAEMPALFALGLGRAPAVRAVVASLVHLGLLQGRLVGPKVWTPFQLTPEGARRLVEEEHMRAIVPGQFAVWLRERPSSPPQRLPVLVLAIPPESPLATVRLVLRQRTLWGVRFVPEEWRVHLLLLQVRLTWDLAKISRTDLPRF
jgi:hypothetical protein